MTTVLLSIVLVLTGMEPPQLPLPSQSNMSASHPSVFVNGDGSPINVFAEACSIKGRPKLMRTLRVRHVIFSNFIFFFI